MIHHFLSANRIDSPWLHVILAGCLFLLVYCMPLQSRHNWHGDAYFWTGDTHTYVGFKGWTDPWLSHRSIGYPAVLYLFLYPHRQKFLDAFMEKAVKPRIDWLAGPEEPIYDIAAEAGVAKRFEALARFQRGALAIALAIFYLSLCRWFSPGFSFVALAAALWLAPPADPEMIMTEPLSSAFTWSCAAFMLFAPRCSRQSLFFALACLCASCAFLLRPQTLSLTGICSLIFLWQLVTGAKKGVRALLKPTLAFSPLLIAYGYIGWLSITGGQLFLHTHPNMHYSAFCRFAEAEDAQYMPTERARKFTLWFGEHKEEFLHKLVNGEAPYPKITLDPNDSPPWRRRRIGDNLSYGPLREVWAHFKNEKGLAGLNLRQRIIFGKELNSGLWQRHRTEIFVNGWQNFLGGLGYYKDIWQLSPWPPASFAINIGALVLSLGAIGMVPKVRWPLGIMVAIHIMALLAAAVGHHMISRYVEPTEAFFLLAGICALRALGARAYRRWKKSPGALPVSGFYV
ncbi:MAG: hypothetical protein HDQ89_09385 [Desulfovibrio sp.]|nr:hypothetical protein [Desulfovibrio sp.]